MEYTESVSFYRVWKNVTEHTEKSKKNVAKNVADRLAKVRKNVTLRKKIWKNILTNSKFWI